MIYISSRHSFHLIKVDQQIKVIFSKKQAQTYKVSSSPTLVLTHARALQEDHFYKSCGVFMPEMLHMEQDVPQNSAFQVSSFIQQATHSPNINKKATCLYFRVKGVSPLTTRLQVVAITCDLRHDSHLCNQPSVSSARRCRFCCGQSSS